MASFIKHKEPSGEVRYICKNCMKTLLISDETTEVKLPDKCGHCGAPIEKEADLGEE